MDININVSLGEGLLGPLNDKPVIVPKKKKKKKKKREKSLLQQAIESSIPVRSEYETVTI